MAKLYASVESEKGKIVGTGGNEYLDIDVKVGNARLAAFTVRRGEIPETDGAEGWVLYDADDEPVCWIEDEKKAEVCTKHNYCTDYGRLKRPCRFREELKGKKHSAK